MGRAEQGWLLLTRCRFMAWRPTRGPTEGFCWDYQLLSAVLTFSPLIWELTENRGCPSSSPTLHRGHGQSLCALGLALCLGFCSEAALSHKPSLGRGVCRRGGGGALQSCPDKASTRSVSSRTLLSSRQMLGLPCLARGLRGQCHTLTECSPLFRPWTEKKNACPPNQSSAA